MKPLGQQLDAQRPRFTRERLHTGPRQLPYPPQGVHADLLLPGGGEPLIRAVQVSVSVNANLAYCYLVINQYFNYIYPLRFRRQVEMNIPCESATQDYFSLDIASLSYCMPVH